MSVFETIDVFRDGLMWIGLGVLALLAAVCAFVGLQRVWRCLCARLRPVAMSAFALAAALATCEAQKRLLPDGGGGRGATALPSVTAEEIAQGWRLSVAEVSVTPPFLPHLFPGDSAELTATVSGCHPDAYLGCTWHGAFGERTGKCNVLIGGRRAWGTDAISLFNGAGRDLQDLRDIRDGNFRSLSSRWSWWSRWSRWSWRSRWRLCT